jgi:two-component system LytT family response regulator
MLTAIIVDDELKGRNSLRQKLTEYCPQVTILGEAEDGDEGLKLIRKHAPNIIFLDIEMPRMNGFEMLHHVREKNFHLIFTTAYDQYAIKAIRYAAFDYLLKPVDIDELKNAVSKVEQAAYDHHTKEKLEVLEQSLSGQFHLHRIAIPTMEGLTFFNLSDIIYLQAMSNYSVIFFTDRPKLLTSRTLGEFEDVLPSQTFFRPHHSFIINIHHIKRYLKGMGGKIEMTNGDWVYVSRSRKEEFLKIIR